MLAVGIATSSLVLIHDAIAQQPTDAARIARLLRQEARVGDAITILRQERGPQPRASLDAIGDSLAAIALTFMGDSAKAARARTNARHALLLSGLQERAGVPYPGAAERLLRIALEGDAAGALWSLTQLPDRQNTIRLMVQVATSSHKLAYAAVGHLARDLEEQGLGALRALYIQRRVTESQAVKDLERIAEYRGWK